MSDVCAITTDPAAPVCYRCGEAVESVPRNGWAAMAHRGGRTDHGVAVAYPPTPVAEPTVRIADEGGHFAVYLNRHDGRGEILRGTAPTGRGAQYPEARARGYAAGLATAQRWAREAIGA